MKRKIVKESYEVSPELADRLNSILSDEYLATETYHMAQIAMVGKKQHLLEEIAGDNAKDEFEDHFANLCKWMQSKGIKVVTKHSEMEQLTNCTKFDISDGMSTEEIIDMLITSEQEAIDVYEEVIPQTDLDLKVMLCGFLKDEREHLKALQDAKNEMGGSPAPVADNEVADNEVELDDEVEEEF